ncbi:T9SS type A sorting domain-containing protein [Flammeovirga yaeyamensis]|nr:T9SS type A sorting domain-containing protein [Flammeovirga yaeyamensis]MBB3699838.1 hypothetical protein [Flammeovirga yaeyamensis]NMF36593.1 T9SS type A sorting domain-containing protein [Flammeovirga yaeyamensis]
MLRSNWTNNYLLNNSSSRLNQTYKYKLDQTEFFIYDDSKEEWTNDYGYVRIEGQYKNNQLIGLTGFSKNNKGEIVVEDNIKLEYSDHLLTSLIFEPESGKYRTEDKLFYDDNSLLIKVENTWYDGDLEETWFVTKYEYNDFQQLVQIDYIEGGYSDLFQTLRYNIFYNEKEQVIKVEKSIFDSEKHQEFEKEEIKYLEYNEVGSLNKETVYSKHFDNDSWMENIYTLSEYLYDDNELVVMNYSFLVSGKVLSSKKVYEFDFDYKRSETLHFFNLDIWDSYNDRNLGQLEYFAKQYTFYRFTNNEFIPIEKEIYSYSEIKDDQEEGGITSTINSIEKDLVIYPNPTSNTLYFKNSTLGNTSTLQLINTNGTVYSFENVYQGLDISNLPKGIYVYKLIDGNNNFQKGKVIIE